MSHQGKIVIIGPAHPLRGGLASYNERLAREFQRNGYDVTIYTFSYQYPKFLFPGTTQYSSEPAPKNLDIRQAINSVNPLNWLRVGRELRKLRPDFVVVRYWLPFMGPCLGTILRKVKKNQHSRIICIADNIVPHEKRPGDRWFTRYFAQPVDRFITMSENVLSQLRTIVPDKPAAFVPHPLYDHFGNIMPVADARRHLGINPDDRVLLFFGFIRKYKGLDMLLRAMKILLHNPANQDMKLLIAGEFYEDRSHYASLLEDPQLAPHLLLHTDFIPDSQVKYYLCAADVTVQPYRNATQSGVTPLSYHFEVPMIVTNVGGLPAMVPDGKSGLIAQPDAADIAQKIEAYYALGKDAFLPGLREEKLKYTWSALAKSILQ